MRGDVYELRAPRDVRGNEQRGRHYGVVVQSDRLALTTWLISSTSTSAMETDFRPEIEIASSRPSTKLTNRIRS